MKKILLGLALLAAAVALLAMGYLVLFVDGEDPEETALSPHDPSATPDEETGAPAALTTPGNEDDDATPTGEETERSELALEAMLNDLRRRSEEGDIELRGRVVLPAGVPVDRTMLVHAFEADLSPQELYGQAGAVPGLRERGNPSTAFLAATAVGTDGAFRITLPADRKSVWLAIDGTYLYSFGCEQVILEEGAPDILLQPRVGARITGRLALPSGTSSPAQHFKLARASLIPDTSTFSMARIAGGWMFERKARVKSDGTFEFRAVDTGRAYEAIVSCEGFASHAQSSFTLVPGRDYPLLVELVTGLSLRGRVIDEFEQPVAEVKVAAQKPILWGIPAGPEYAATLTDASGEFSVEHVPVGRMVLVARHEEYLENPPEVLELEEGEHRGGIVLRISRGAVLSGVVRWPDGAPAAGADVQVRFDPSAMMGPSALNAMTGGDGNAKTGEDGTFTVGGLGKGPFELTARATRRPGTDTEEAGRVQRAGLLPDTEGLELVLAPPPVLHGRVVNEAGAPVTEFEVRADSAGAMMYVMGENRVGNFKDADGTFALGGLYEGPWEIVVHADGYGPSGTMSVDLPRPSDAEPVLIVLHPPASVAGFVMDPSGDPIAGARVTIEAETNKAMARLAGRMKLPVARSGEDGAYLLTDLSAGDVGVVASHPEYAASTTVSVAVEPAFVVPDVTLTLRKGGILTGEVYGRDGEPATGTTLVVQDPTTFEPTIATTDATGRFRLEKLTPGSYTVTAMLNASEKTDDEEGGEEQGFLGGLMENILLASADIVDGEETHVVLGAPPANPIRVFGTVTHGGEPAAHLMITFVPEGATAFAGMKMEETDEEGRYEVEIDGPGNLLVTVAAFDTSEGMQQNSIEFSRSVPEVEAHQLDLELPVGRITGTVFGPDREPLPAARITLTSEGGVAYGTIWGGQYAETTTRDDGTYELTFLRPGTYSVAAGGALFGGFLGTKKGEGRQIRNGVTIAEGQHLDRVDFHLKKPGDITGTIVDETGKPVSGVAVFVRDTDGNLLERFSMNASGADGKFRYPGVSPGNYTITARGSGLASIEGNLVRVTEGKTTDVTVVMVGGTTLLITVIDRTGKEVRARVSVRDEQGREVNGMVSLKEIMQSQSGPSLSHQQVGPLPPGRYVITAVADDGRQVTKPVTLTGQAERRIKVRLR